jgi:hypothetical protein
MERQAETHEQQGGREPARGMVDGVQWILD